MTERDLDDTVKTWVLGQLAVWQARRVSRRAALAEHEHYNATRGSTFLFHIKDGRVGVAPKPDDLVPKETDWAWMMPSRAEQYRGFLQEVLDRRPPPGEGVLAMDMHDGAFESETAPMFAFQKPVGSHAVLLNEIDAIGSNFYSIGDVQDGIAYGDKRPSAVFVGGSTGMNHTCESVRRLEAERLRAGVFLCGDPCVDYRLPLLSQFAEPQAEAMVRQVGFGRGATSWREQFQHKFMLSLDGNGATCSRVAIALKSNGVLMKYNSPHMLHYFTSLEPWRHYIPIAHDAEAPLYVEVERNEPGRFAAIAEQSRDFYEAYLTREAQLAYASELLESYFASFEREASSPGWRESEPRASVSAAAWRDEGWVEVGGWAHVSGRGDVQATGNLFGEAMGKRPIEGFLLEPPYGVDLGDLQYQAVGLDGEGEWVNLGAFAGSRSEGRPLRGLRMRSRTGDAFTCQLAASFLDGSYRFDPGEAGAWEALGSASLQTFRAIFRCPVTRMSGLAHIAGRGDIWRAGATQGEPGGGEAIEGFQIDEAAGLQAEDLEYQAVTSIDDYAGAWTPMGGFAGRRRTGSPLMGLRVRLHGGTAETLAYRLHATFVDGSSRTDSSRGGMAAVRGIAALESFTLDFGGASSSTTPSAAEAPSGSGLPQLPGKETSRGSFWSRLKGS